ncbi:hypothetical protein LguiA_006422 [Lonicera macranthoides]
MFAKSETRQGIHRSTAETNPFADCRHLEGWNSWPRDLRLLHAQGGDRTPDTWLREEEPLPLHHTPWVNEQGKIQKQSPAVSKVGLGGFGRTFAKTPIPARGPQFNSINVVLTSSDVAVDGFCSSRCGTHGSLASKSFHVKGKNYKFAYIWVGNSETRCLGYCAWPFHQPIYGPQGPPLVAPNNDMGVDGMVMNLASLLARTMTNPFGNGFYQRPASAPLKTALACPGIYGKGAYPGYAWNLLKDPATGASYNAHSANGRKYLVPALYDPSTSSCSTLV